MKTPDEIKKGLSELKKLRALMTFNPMTGEDIDPLFLNEENRELYEGVSVVLQHIQQLEAQNAEQAERIRQLEAERDAAVKDFERCVATDDNICRYCQYRYTAAEEHCLDCDGDGFKWRGVQKEE